ncbi:MAG: alkyl hydroperoxide reductase [Armatimonadaceae bacterium]
MTILAFSMVALALAGTGTATNVKPEVAALPQPRKIAQKASDGGKPTRKTSTRSRTSSGISFHEKVQHIVQQRCVPCHRTGGVGPFSLDGYDAVKARARMIGAVVDAGNMPPWFATEGGPWRNDMSLSGAEKRALKAWIDSGMPKGDPKLAPVPAVYEAGWSIGKPDAVFALPEPVTVKESGVMPYVNINVPTRFTEDKWVEKIEVIPGDRRAVHHVLVFARTAETANLNRRDRLANADTRDELGGFFGIYVPGNSALTYPNGMAKRIPKGAVLRFQIHYTPYGKESTDQTKIGFVFAKEPPKHEVRTASIANLRFAIPPGAANHRVDAEIRVPSDVQILSFLPHMLVRAKAARYELDSEGNRRTVLDVARYDFNWQLNYVLKEPLAVRAGDRIHFTAWYDNSEGNPANPDPSKTVRWGSQTFDEMHLGYVEYIVPGAKPGEDAAGLRRAPAGALGGAGGAAQMWAALQRLDRNNDGAVTETEAGLFWSRIRDADDDRDGKLTLVEIRRFFLRQRQP